MRSSAALKRLESRIGPPQRGQLQPVRAGSPSPSEIVREGRTRAMSRRHSGNRTPHFELVKKP